MMKTDLFSIFFRRFVVVLLMVLPLGLFAREVYGDVNGDLEVNIADVNSVINIILNGNGATGPADVNNDGEINIADVNAVIDVILGGGIDPYLMEVCNKVVEIDEEVTEYYMQCESIEELMRHADDIEALDGVEYIFSNDNSTLYVVIKDFGTISYSYYPIVESNDDFNSVSIALTKANIGEIHGHLMNQGDFKALLAFQMSKDNDWYKSGLYLNALSDHFGYAGIDSEVRTTLDVEFFRNGIFDCDYLCLLTHGGYEFDEKEYNDDNLYRGLHWLLTTEEISKNTLIITLAKMRLKYDKQDVSYDHVKEIRNGKKVDVIYKKVSDHFIESSNKSFNHPGKGIVFNSACHSMQGPGLGVYEGDSINYHFATVFAQKGAGIYLGYDKENAHGNEGAMQFYCNLISGMSLKSAYDNLQFQILHDYKIKDSRTWWADLVQYYSSDEFLNNGIVRPSIIYNDESTENELKVDLHATIHAASFYSQFEYAFNENDGWVESSVSGFDFIESLKYGFQLCESEQFSNAVLLGERSVHDEGCEFDESRFELDFSQLLSNNSKQTDSQIKPNTTYWVRAYVHDGQGYNYSDPISFTTGSLADDQPTAETFMANGVPFTMVNVEGGTFTMGATDEQGTDANDAEKPAHKVTLSSFAIGQTEVTQALWLAVMGSNPSDFTGDLNRPVEQVSWNDCQLFISKLNELNLTDHQFRLPTDAEWEFAARGGNMSQGYKYAGSNNIDEVAWYNNNSSSTHLVGQKTANELGIYDMSGNVWEWCQDWFGNFSSDDQINPMGPESGTKRCMRSGSWDFGPWFCRVSHRNYDSPDRKSNHLGFRIAYGDMSALPISLSENELMLSVNEQRTVNIFNGSGNYSVRGEAGIVSVQINGDLLTIKGSSTGSTTLIITDNSHKTHFDLPVFVHKSHTYDVYGVSFTLVDVEGGTFIMGASDDDNEARNEEKPAHQVTLSSFAIGQTEVTQALWQAVMGNNPSVYSDDELNCPVENISFIDCLTFIEKLNQITGKQFRMPTEAEWEFAARGGNMSQGYKYAGSNNVEDVAWYDLNSFSINKAHRQVGMKKCNELGLFDMSGNVEEMCYTFYYRYSSEPQTNPTGPSSGSKCITRGGDWTSWATYCRVTSRLSTYVNDPSSDCGFRLAMDAE